MDVSGSDHQWSSGCESGWTGYLYESYLSNNTNSHHINVDDVGISKYYNYNNYQPEQQQQEEDLSMVSDASSGPPQEELHENCIFRNVKEKKCQTKSKKSTKDHQSKKNKHLTRHHQQFQNSYTNNNNLDDTASSPAVSCYSKMYGNPSNINQEHFMGFSQDLSASHFQGNSAFSNHYAFWQSSHPDNADSAEPSHMRGRRWE